MSIVCGDKIFPKENAARKLFLAFSIHFYYIDFKISSSKIWHCFIYILSSICSKLCEELCCTRLGYAQIQMMFLDIQPKKKNNSDYKYVLEMPTHCLLL